MKRPKVSVQITDRDLRFKDLKKRIAPLKKNPYVKVGVQGASGLEAKTGGESVTVVDVATIHEFGSSDGRIPERSFIRSTMDQEAPRFFDEMREQSAKLFDPKSDTTVSEVLGVMGESIQAAIQGKFRDNDWPPLAGPRANRPDDENPTPLVDTGQLRRSIRYVKVMDGKK